MPTEILHPYVSSRKDVAAGRPIIAVTRTRVANIVAYYKLGLTPEDLARELPHLSLSQIHDALSGAGGQRGIRKENAEEGSA